jgi:hypothetical protein
LHHAPCAIHSSPWILQFQVLFITFVFASFTAVVFPLFFPLFHHASSSLSQTLWLCFGWELSLFEFGNGALFFFNACITCFDNVPESLEFFSYVLTALINVPSRCNLSINAKPYPSVLAENYRHFEISKWCIDDVILPYVHRQCTCTCGVIFLYVSRTFSRACIMHLVYCKLYASFLAGNCRHLNAGTVHCSSYPLPSVCRQCTRTSASDNVSAPLESVESCDFEIRSPFEIWWGCVVRPLTMDLYPCTRSQSLCPCRWELFNAWAIWTWERCKIYCHGLRSVAILNSRTVHCLSNACLMCINNISAPLESVESCWYRN